MPGLDGVMMLQWLLQRSAKGRTHGERMEHDAKCRTMRVGASGTEFVREGVGGRVCLSACLCVCMCECVRVLMKQRE